MKEKSKFSHEALLSSNSNKESKDQYQSMSIEDSENLAELQQLIADHHTTSDRVKGIIFILLSTTLFTATASICKYGYTNNESLDGFDYMIFRGGVLMLSKCINTQILDN